MARCPADVRASTPERARLHRPDVRQPRNRTLTAQPTPADLLPRANLDAQGGLDFLSVDCVSEVSNETWRQFAVLRLQSATISKLIDDEEGPRRKQDAQQAFAGLTEALHDYLIPTQHITD